MNFQRQKALDSYYKNPNICLYCGKIIEVPEGIKFKYIRDKKFCNSSCSAKYNNSIRKLNKKVELSNVIDTSLMGGIKVVVNDTVFDNSIANKVQSLKQELLNGKDVR